MTQPSEGQRKQVMLKELEGLEQQSEFVEWHDGYEIKQFVMKLIKVLKKG